MTCTRCNGKLSTAAKAARSEVCTTCAIESGLTAIPVMALAPFRDEPDWHWIIDRYLNNGPRWREVAAVDDPGALARGLTPTLFQPRAQRPLTPRVRAVSLILRETEDSHPSTEPRFKC